MAPHPKVVIAFRTMRDLGISEVKVKPVLKRLLKLYDKNWDLIEEDNYRLLADVIFEEDDTKEEEAMVDDEPDRPVKRFCSNSQVSPSVNDCNYRNDETLLTPKLENETELSESEIRFRVRSHNEMQLPQSTHSNIARNKGKQPALVEPLAVQGRSEPKLLSSAIHSGLKRKEPLSPHAAHRVKTPISQLPSHGVCSKEPVIVANNVLPNQKAPGNAALIKPKDEPFTDDMPEFEVPIAVKYPDPSNNGDSSAGNVCLHNPGPSSNGDSSAGNIRLHKPDLYSNGIGDLSAGNVPIPNPDSQQPPLPQNEDARNSGDDVLASCRERRTNSEVASLPQKSLSNLDCVPSPLVEERDLLKNSTDPDNLGTGVDKKSFITLSCNLSEFVDIHCSTDTSIQNCVGANKETLDDHNHEMLKSPHDVNDITKGEERVRISWVNEVNSDCPQFFHYIPRSLVFQNADATFSLSSIGDGNCCSTCFGNCLSSLTSSSCRCRRGGEFSYTSEGILREEFLETCISVNLNPRQPYPFYCEKCPLERPKEDESVETCRGHARKKFIKECWSKCGCSKKCGNRVVQRGISCNLQVFLTPDGRGWGLRTLEELQKGAFVCEYVGEIITNVELYERKMQSTSEKSYEVILDADWASGTPVDDKALCLDATYYGNVARFINHRCLDANLVEIPVEVESADHHYYHLAFFTTRKVEAFEELTWDYGLDFEDHDHLARTFRCRCGSQFCRNMKRSNRSRSKLVSR